MWEKSKDWRKNIGAQKNKTVQERFWEKVDHKGGYLNGIDGDCWEWLGAKDKDGYGFIRYEGKNVRSHRFMYRFLGIGIPLGIGVPSQYNVLHKCDNPSCVKPGHLFIGSNSDNQIDCARKGRRLGQRLCIDDVKRIRDMRRCGADAKTIATLFQITPGYVYHIQYRKKWAHVD